MESMDSDREQSASALARDLSFIFPFIFGLIGRRRGVGGGGEEETADVVVERIVVLDPAMQRMFVIEAAGGAGASLEELVRQASEEESGKRGPPPASAASIEAMPAVEVSAEAGLDCAVCLEGVVGAAKEMPCRHRYHQGCVEKWLAMHGSCPVCRYKMPEEEMESGKKGESGGGEEDGRREIWVSYAVNRDRDASEERRRRSDSEEQ